MEWVRAHPYTSALLASCLLLVAGLLIVQRRSLATPAAKPAAWGGGATLLNPTAFDPHYLGRANVGVQPEHSANPIGSAYIPPEPSSIGSITANAGFDFAAFLAQLSGGTQQTQSTNASANPDAMLDPYTFIPSDLISTSSAVARSGNVQALYDYGNTIGAYIQSFESQNRTMVQVLKGQVEDRSDPVKKESVRSLGRAMSAIGTSMLGLDGVPDAVESAHNALARAYEEAGEALGAIPDAERDQEFVAAITAYNGKADTLTKRYVDMALFFSIQGVRFNSEDAGSVFTFNPAAQ